MSIKLKNFKKFFLHKALVLLFVWFFPKTDVSGHASEPIPQVATLGQNNAQNEFALKSETKSGNVWGKLFRLSPFVLIPANAFLFIESLRKDNSEEYEAKKSQIISEMEDLKHRLGAEPETQMALLIQNIEKTHQSIEEAERKIKDLETKDLSTLIAEKQAELDVISGQLEQLRFLRGSINQEIFDKMRLVLSLMREDLENLRREFEAKISKIRSSFDECKARVKLDIETRCEELRGIQTQISAKEQNIQVIEANIQKLTPSPPAFRELVRLTPEEEAELIRILTEIKEKLRFFAHKYLSLTNFPLELSNHEILEDLARLFEVSQDIGRLGFMLQEEFGARGPFALPLGAESLVEEIKGIELDVSCLQGVMVNMDGTSSGLLSSRIYGFGNLSKVFCQHLEFLAVCSQEIRQLKFDYLNPSFEGVDRIRREGRQRIRENADEHKRDARAILSERFPLAPTDG